MSALPRQATLPTSDAAPRSALFRQRQEQFAEQLRRLRSTTLWVSYSRLAVACVAVVVLYYWLTGASTSSNTALGYALLLCVAVFVWLVNRHARLIAQERHVAMLVRLNAHEAQACQSAADNASSTNAEQPELPEPLVFGDGQEYSEAEHLYATDLDVLGAGGLFEHLNRTCTRLGSERLAAMLLRPLASLEALHQRQEAIQELAFAVEFRQTFCATGLQHAERAQDPQMLTAWLQEPLVLLQPSWHRAVLRVLVWCVPVLLLVLLVLIGVAAWLDGSQSALLSVAVFKSLVQYSTVLGSVFGLGFVLNLALVALFQRHINAAHTNVARKNVTVGKYARLLRLVEHHLVEHHQVHTPLLKDAVQQAHGAVEAFHGLARLAAAFDQRLNGFNALLLNGVLLYDMHCVLRLERWRKQHRQSVQTWFAALAEVDALCSYAAFAYNHPEYTLPTILATSEPFLQAEALAHPLLAPNGRVANSFSLQAAAQHQSEEYWASESASSPESQPAPQFAIITGANMAGKSTFLRAVGVNAVLALTGGVVCAERFSCSLMQIATSMRASDSLQHQESYFYAELKRLRSIINALETAQMLTLVLLDEILRGTNSRDKQQGSLGVVKRLLGTRSIGALATHDVVLGTLAEHYPGRVQNYRFEGVLHNDERGLTFDYRLQTGIVENLNATWLLHSMGIIGQE
jgi:hypothetical protein